MRKGVYLLSKATYPLHLQKWCTMLKSGDEEQLSGVRRFSQTLLVKGKT